MNSHSHPLPSLLVKGWGFALFLLFVSITATAQDIRIKSFERNLMDPGASLAPVKDANGVPCARIRFSVQNRNLKVEPNLGAVKTRRMDGEVWVYVPEGTKKFTLRCGNALPLRDYVIPVKIESKVTYDCVVEITNLKYAFAKERVVYINAGYNAVALSGPSLGVGVSLKRHNFEIGAVVGVNKSNGLYFYDQDDDIAAAYKYHATRAYARYGYEFPLTDFLKVVPQVGAAANFINGSKVSGVTLTRSDYMKSASSVSGLLAVRLLAELNDHFRVQLTPEYDFALSKNDVCKTLNKADNTIKSWTEGFNLNLGFLIYF